MIKDICNQKNIISCLLILIFFSCSPLPDMVSTEKNGNTYSADDVRRMSVDQPFQLSGDYFRERDEKPSRNLNALFPKEKKDGATAPSSGEAEKRTVIAAAAGGNAEKSAAETASPPPAPVPGKTAETKGGPVKTGLILDKDNMDADRAEQILNALPSAAQDLPVIFASQEKVDEVMAGAECPPRDLQCISAMLSAYPGVRMLILIETFRRQPTGEILARIGVVDTGILFRYPTMEIRIPDNPRAVSAVLRQVLSFAVKKSEIMPWFCRPFSSDKDEWYVSAGKKSGLKRGQELAVISPGKVIQSPIGLPAGWLPGQKRGVLKIRQLFGEDFALCTLENGKEPNPEDLLMLP
ncbi:MAG: hypothetical protein V2I97_09040 [Desulfococcaceae bacterium]|jgi:hypothetical protein|nr:hypothetical protein [Desulfococcaceae bacterium]